MTVKLDFTLMPPEFFDVVMVLQQAASSGKYARNGWLEGKNFDEDKNLASIQRHLLDRRKNQFVDPESGLDPSLHGACRFLMDYTVRMRAIKKP